MAIIAAWTEMKWTSVMEACEDRDNRRAITMKATGETGEAKPI